MEQIKQQAQYFDFIKIAKITLWLSIILVIAGLGLVFTRGFSWGVDFAGGNQLRITFDKDTNVSRESLEKDLSSLKIPATITQVNNKDKIEFFLYYPADNKDNNKLIQDFFEKEYHSKWKILSENFVGSKMGQQFRKIAISSTLVILLLILIYIAFRFNYRFGVAAIISLLHDVIIVLCFISFIRLPFTISILAAILTVIGYSLNDTIVIFDRMRSERKLLSKDTLSSPEYYSLVNRSIYKSLTRTCLTAGTTIIVLSILYFIGGAELQPMSLVLILGVLIGTISSNLVAPPILYLWNKKDLKQSSR